ncbi:MAG TPA: tripartite tricarboxylate transporter permease [Alphaproteobacteria bacterium]|jgi:putative tricarboxylic transport membrane protein
MDTFNALMHGFSVALTLANLGWALLGVTLGTAVGVLPGIGPALTVALLLPITFNLEPTSAFIMFAGIYYGGMYGGSTTSILLNTPGESASIITSIEGNLMAKRGRAGPALATAAIGSFVAGSIATAALTFLAPAVADFALRFGPADYFAIMVLSFTTVSAVLGNSLPRGLASLLFGVALGLVGIDSQTGQARFALGIPQMLDGIDVVIVVIGLFAVGETLYVATRKTGPETMNQVKGATWMSKLDWARSWKPWLRGTALGFPFGAMPSGGGEIPTFMSYAIEKKLTKHPGEFGHGAIEGVAGPEAANNAAAAGVLVPLLTLGLPTSATAAIMLAAFQQYGLQPGPLLFDTNPDLVWGLIASLYVGNVMLLVLNLPLVGLWVKLLTIPRPYLYGGILIFATLGTYSLNNSVVDLITLYVVGVAGFLMRRFDIPVAPAVIGLILGPLAEQQMRRALSISQGDFSIFVTEPISAALLALACVVLIGPMIWKATHRDKAAGTPA